MSDTEQKRRDRMFRFELVYAFVAAICAALIGYHQTETKYIAVFCAMLAYALGLWRGRTYSRP